MHATPLSQQVATEETGALQHAVDLAGQQLVAAQVNISEAFQSASVRALTSSQRRRAPAEQQETG